MSHNLVGVVRRDAARWAEEAVRCNDLIDKTTNPKEIADLKEQRDAWLRRARKARAFLAFLTSEEIPELPPKKPRRKNG
jgi:hypothetical protein